MMKCECGNEMHKEKRSLYQDKAEELDNLYFNEVTIELCDNCGIELIHYYKINQLYRTIAQAIVLQPWLLRGQDIKFLRKERSIKLADWAMMLATDPTTLSDIESNKLPITPQFDMATRLLYCRIFEEQEDRLFPKPFTHNFLNRKINLPTLAIAVNMQDPTTFEYLGMDQLKLAS